MKLSRKLKLVGHGFDVFSLFCYLTKRFESKYAFLLESIGEKNRPLYSFICFNPDYLLRIKGSQAQTTDINNERGERLSRHLKTERQSTKDEVIDDRVENKIYALDLAEARFPETHLKRPKGFSRQVFCGGYLGYLAYDIVAPWVGFKSKSTIPDAILGMHTTLLIYDHLNEALILVTHTVDGADDGEDFESALLSYRKPSILNLRDFNLNLEGFKSNTNRKEFYEMVNRAKDYLWNGEILQAVISRRVDYSSRLDDIAIYHALRKLNPSPYMYYLNFGELRFVGSSPEALVSLNRTKITTVPIAGTRRRGLNAADEAKMLKELVTDAKESAEHVMLVDLARNDVSKVSEPGSIKTRAFMSVKKYQHVMHLVTTVDGLLRRGMSCFDVVKCMFPAGTVSGAPKLRAMEIIQELEKESRGAYAGAIGYFSFSGDIDWAITIRTIQLLNSMVSVQAGGGIVADSQPRLEWIETENKMRSLLKAIKVAEVASRR